MSRAAPDVLSQLKTRTRPQHEALEAEVPLLTPGSSVDDVRRFLAGMYGFLRPLEPQLLADGELNRLGFELPRRAKLKLLEDDLRALEADVAALPVAPQLPSLDSSGARLGYLYVIEGSTLGSQVLKRALLERHPRELAPACRYFTGYGDETGPMWKIFGERMRAYVEGGANPEPVLAAAQETFECLRLWLKTACDVQNRTGLSDESSMSRKQPART